MSLIEMKKLLETMEDLGREPVIEAPIDVADQLEEVYEELLEAVDNLRQLFRMIPDRELSERARRGVLSHLETALNDEHQWIGRNDTTLADVIYELRSGEEEE
jgi:hypothetical protein